MRRIGSTRGGVALSCLLTVALAQLGRAQLPNAPVLQNAFVNPGITAALNFSNLSGASSYAGAAAWAPGSARFQVSAGLGAQTHSGGPTRTVYGARVNVPFVGATSSLGFSAFVGYGVLSGGGSLDSSEAKSVVPLGVTAGYRKPIGTSHGFSIYGRRSTSSWPAAAVQATSTCFVAPSVWMWASPPPSVSRLDWSSEDRSQQAPESRREQHLAAQSLMLSVQAGSWLAFCPPSS